MSFFSDLFKSENYKCYRQFLRERVQQKDFDKLYQEKAKALRSGLFGDEVVELHDNFLKEVFLLISTDQKINRDENIVLEKAATMIETDPKLLPSWNQENYNKYRLRGHISEKEVVVFPPDAVGISLKSDEEMYLFIPAYLIKKRKRTRKINYSGLSYKVKITRGLSYRVGSIKPSVSQSEFLSKEDIGLFWITNKRVGFKGKSKNISIDLNKLAAFEIDELMLKVFKEGKESAYLFHIDDLDTVCALISLILNEDYKALKDGYRAA